MTTSAPASLRRTSRLDGFLAEANRALQVLTGVAQASRPNPANASAASPAAADTLSPAERARAARLMRVNHVGEICAQALYRGQATIVRDNATRRLFEQAAQEEVDHLAWLNQRLRELNGRPSLLNPLWYAGSFALGALAARAGTPYNLGFMAETERQVGEHLASHLEKLPADDQRSRDIVEQMRLDEAGHQRQAEQAGGRELPAPARLAMRAMSKVMTTTAHWV
ncbi:MAG: 2-polyprenyl-3-methyl-6-methoxy-1,4-benzoquinone monooxygenase [Pigmentiphaga sp.]|nr:2-polyprenyl-3-methyl-6-methoxy-1,4-benzoquinone monooxygenase [Pigmentiphaga sp.]